MRFHDVWQQVCPGVGFCFRAHFGRDGHWGRAGFPKGNNLGTLHFLWVGKQKSRDSRMVELAAAFKELQL